MKRINLISLSAVLALTVSSAMAYDFDYNYSEMTFAQNSSHNNSDSYSLFDSDQNDASVAPLSSLPKRIAAPHEKEFIFNPKLRKWAAYDSMGDRVAYGRANGGADFCAELGHPCHSPVGIFHVYREGGPECKSKEFPLGKGGAEMPWCMYFHNGDAIHGETWVSYANRSHGCIRVTTPAAQWLHANFIQRGTKVMVLSY